MKLYPEIKKMMCARHYDFGGILVGYHDNSDKSNSDWKSGGGALCTLTFDTYYPTLKDFIAKSSEVVRDPCISLDAKKVVFAISGNGSGTGYKIWEADLSDPTKMKQLTDDDGMPDVVADFEPCYLPNGNIMFTSTRNFGLVDCAFNPSTNMFLMNGDGTGIHQIGFDQVNTFYPVLQDDGSVLYSRWEYNDRDLTNSMGLFTMSPDGSHQTEWFGNQTPWPFVMYHGKIVPGSKGMKAMCVGGGHHGPYSGELMLLDRSKETNGAACMQMLAPVRDAKPTAKKSDAAMGNVAFLFQNPLPLDEENLIVSWRKSESAKFQLYFMNIDGSRELLAWGSQSISQPVLIQPRNITKMPLLQANYNDSVGIVTLQDVYYGPGMAGVSKESGVATRLRVVELSYRMSGSAGSYGQVMGSAPSGAFAPAITCPVSTYGASWECKKVLGEAKIYPDGSASFKVPARKPVYFQVIDTNGYCIASMRSWATLMPGEKFSCVGCHESKVEAPPTGAPPLAVTAQDLDKPLGIEGKPFDYIDIVQPILNDKCISCHKGSQAPDLSGTLKTSASRQWATSYNNLTSGISTSGKNNYINISFIFSTPEQKKPYSYGSSQSALLTKAINGTNEKMNKLLSKKEKDIIACWVDLAAPSAGTYDAHLTNASGYQNLMKKRDRWAAIEAKNIKDIVSVIPNGHGAVQSTRPVAECRGIGYLPTQHALVLNNASQGKLVMVDLSGKVIYSVKLSDQRIATDATIVLPSSISSGIYIAKFEDVSGIQQAKINIMR